MPRFCSPWGYFGQRFALLAVVCSALTVWAGAANAQAASPSQLPAVAVWDFDDHTVAAATSLSQLDFLKRTLSEAVLGTLVEVPGLKVVDRLRLKDVLTEQKLGASNLADEDARIRLGRIIGAQRMVFGSFMALGDQIQVSLRVVDTATSQVMFADEYTAGYDLVLTDAQKIAAQLAATLGGRLTQPGKTQALSLWAEYDQALAFSDSGHYAEAIEALKKLLAKNKDFAPAERQLLAVLEKMARQ